MPTIAEQTDFRDTATGAQCEQYMGRLATEWPNTVLTTLGRTIEGRSIWGLIVEPRVTTETKPITVLLLGGIHSGECDGKEALFALARDMVRGEQGDWWHKLRIIFVPNFNADGNERRGLTHRPGQAGPELGMGIRENAQGLDLNRDFIKLESPEVRSLVAALSEYDVDVLIDTHTTNGSLHQYQLTYDIPHNPAAPRAIDRWLRGQLIPAVTERLSDAGFNTFYYGNYDSEHRRWSTFGHEARYSTEYMGLRGKIGILSESYSYASYKTRIDVSYQFVVEILKGIVQQESTVRQLLDDSASSASAGQELAVRGKIVKTADGVLTNGYAREDGSPPRGPYGPNSFAQHKKKDYVVQLWNQSESTESIKLPHYYAIPEQYAWAAGRLQRHGVELRRLNGDLRAKSEVYDVTEVEKQREFQGHEILTVGASANETQVDLTAGTYVVRTDQPLGRLAAYLLEPASDDGLAAWNFLDPDVEAGARFPIVRVLEPLPDGVSSPVQTIAATESITVERLLAPGKAIAYGGKAIRGPRWLKSKSEYVVQGGYGRTYAVDAATGAYRRLNELDSLRSKLSSLQAFSPADARKSATIGAFTDDWAHALVSFEKDLYYFNSESDEVRQLTHSQSESEKLAELSPTGDHVAFVKDNNLWLVNCETTEEKQLTTNGSDEVLCGILDWVYQEELYGRGNFKAFWWSPDATQIAFLELDQTPVPRYQVSDSVSYGQNLEETRYPKAGEPLPAVNVWVVDIVQGSLSKVDLSSFDEKDRLIGRVTWSPQNDLWLQVLNRVQNRQDLVRVPGGDGKPEVLFTEASAGWIELRGTPQFLPSGDFLWLSDLPNGRTHLFQVSAETGAKSQLTSGDWEVASLQSISADGQTAFVSGNISSPIERQLISVELSTGAVNQITGAPGTHQTQVDATGRFFIDTFGSSDSPTLASVHSIDGQLLRVVEAPVSDRHQFLNVQPPETFEIEARDGVKLQAQLFLPPGFDRAKPDRQIPVLFYVYGGPQAPTVRNSWNGRYYWWHQMLCQQGIAVLMCDNRSSRGRGVSDTWTIRGDLCRVELQDLQDGVAWATKQPWADPSRFGIWGWSYGGYFTSYALTHTKLFRCGIAGAPVTDWRNYDAIYTERYMDLPQDNEAGYKSSSVVEAASNLHGRLMLIHGERDDNVHISNTLQLAYALQKAGKQFELMVYPKNRHGIVDSQQRYHLFEMMTSFLKRNLLTD